MGIPTFHGGEIMMTRVHGVVLGVAVAGLVCMPTGAQAVDITGTWNLNIVAEASNGETQTAPEAQDVTVLCRWLGQAFLQQFGTSFSGSTSVNLVEGDPFECAPVLTGTVNGQIIGNVITFGTAFGAFGEADFSGEVNPDGQSMNGLWDSEVLSGTWSGVRQAGVAAPALGSSAMAGLAGLLLLGGVWLMRRRSHS
jgi:hypothetical protein